MGVVKRKAAPAACVKLLASSLLALIACSCEGPSDSSDDTSIKVIKATYGGNCKAAPGNLTAKVREACDGRMSCEFVVDVGVIGDPAPGCAKNFAVLYNCGSQEKDARLPPGVGGKKEAVTLSCQK
jgi:hypothetical protein